MSNTSTLNWRVLGFITAGILLCAGWLGWLCQRDNAIPFLPAGGQAEWVVYPSPPDTNPHKAAPLSTTFRRTFDLPATVSTANLSLRAFNSGAVSINGQAVAGLVLDKSQDWKSPRSCDVAKHLRVGDNEISVTVTNSTGPPALWLSLHLPGFTVSSDTGWQASIAGAAWQAVAPASQAPVIRPGNYLFTREFTGDSLRRIWPNLLAILLGAIAVIAGIRRIERTGHSTAPGWFRDPANAPTVILALIIGAWIALFCNNLPLLPSSLGFDRDGHLEYIDYILQNNSLPLANEGWQMYQPPLFYLLSACALGPFGWPASNESALMVLRSISALAGVTHLVLIFLCLRLLFPNQPARQVVGLIVAGFLPANLCLSHHVTNETLSALLVTTALYSCLRLLRSNGNSSHLQIAVGVSLGLAMLAKFSAVIAIPLIFAALVWRRLEQTPKDFKTLLRTIGIVMAGMLVICGWHYVRVSWHFGNPLIGNWDPRLPFAWWQEPGFHTAAWYCRFGKALTTPMFSGFFGFADGIYSSAWADGLCSGGSLMAFRPPWNYDFMNTAGLLALLATALILTGIVVALIQFIRKPMAEWFLLLGMACACAIAIVFMTLRVPSYAQVKAFYALPALLPICALAAVGWDFIGKRSTILRSTLWVGLLIWLITTYSSFWIRRANPFTWTARGVGLASHDARYADALEYFSHALQLDPDFIPARVGLADALTRLNRLAEGRQESEYIVQHNPDNPEGHLQLATVLALAGENEAAIPHFKKTISLMPDHPFAYQRFAACLSRLGQHKEVISVCREGLRVTPFNPDVHRQLARAAIETGDLKTAVAHLGYALDLRPDWPEVRSLLAFTLASLGRVEEASAQYLLAIQQKPNDPGLHCQFAAILAAGEKYREAADHYRQALGLRPDMVESLNNLAWILAASPDDEIRNGEEAVRLAEKACELTHWAPPLMGTLAAAYAEAGRFADAVAMAEKTRDKARLHQMEDLARKNERLLELYRANRAFRETTVIEKR